MFMKIIPLAVLSSLFLYNATVHACVSCGCVSERVAGEWHQLFDGSSLDGWKSNEETTGVFKINDNGELAVEGGRAHLFWIGDSVVGADLVDFELKLEVLTTAGANSGVFFHTKFQERGWPEVGLEAQVNSSHTDARKTGSVYALKDVLDDAPSEDGQWFDYTIRVDGKRVTISVNDVVVNEYVEPQVPVLIKNRPNLRLSRGTIAIQGHDPKSKTYYKNIRLRVLE